MRALRFSIGFGEVLFRRIGRDPDHTEQAICTTPLGGYVKMPGGGSRDSEKDPPVLPEDPLCILNHQLVYKRFAIVAAGPAVNLLLAIAFYAMLAWVGAIKPLPILGVPPLGSTVVQADLHAQGRVIAVDADGETPASVRSWSGVHICLYLIGIAGCDAFIQVRGADGVERTVRLHGLSSAAHMPQADMADQIGLRLFGSPVTIVDMLLLSAAVHTGLRARDQIVHFIGQPADQAMDFVRRTRVMPKWNVSIDILRNNQPMTLPVRPDADTDPKNPTDPKVSKFDVQLNQRVETAMTRDESVVVLGHTVSEIWRALALLLQVLGEVVVGQVSPQNLSELIAVADLAGKTANLGWQMSVSFLALISVSLDVSNLLSAPALDGGYLLYCCVEFLTGQPVPGSWRVIFQKIGVTCILLLTSFALYNDLNRLLLIRGQTVFRSGH